MRKQATVQFIENKGKREWAVIPYEDYVRLCELVSLESEIQIFKKQLKQGEEELIPAEYAQRIINGENTIRVWREYRNISQAKLANLVEISTPYLSQLEHGERKPSMDVLKKISKVLKVSLDDLVD